MTNLIWELKGYKKTTHSKSVFLNKEQLPFSHDKRNKIVKKTGSLIIRKKDVLRRTVVNCGE